MDKLEERDGQVSEGRSVPALAVQFFLIPLAVVVAVILVYGGFRWLLNDERTPQEYLSDIRVGGRERRWPAAFELSRLMADPEVQASEPTLGPALVSAFVESENDDPRVRRYLAMAVGQLTQPPEDAGASLVDALDDPETETRISVIWALGSLGDSSVIPELAGMYASDDAGIRKMTVYALGALPGDEQISTLRTALNDSVPDVQWNAAVALARHGNTQGVGILGRMLDREYVERVAEPTMGVGSDEVDRVGEVMITGLNAIAALNANSFRDSVLQLSRQDESLRVRQAAIEALAVFDAADDRPEGRVRR
ncbi:MAG: HEAT repeat domain-containing protein [Vicinamibacterales bacterium]|nr:HEAT repeat domain-containing protein [Vicinamibacterales bacterium]HJO18557.1 HEAT repeat domain-containing protein [Vicinamibacterales bacterium]|tara:strand:+ start:56722 stop:57651 length:930 start_codon:yes stop_codon:yes gene_type:complete